MKNRNWKDTAELIGIAAIVGSLVFVGLQMRQAEELARLELGYALLGPGHEMRSTIAAHPQVWRKGNLGDELDPDEMIVYEQLIESMWLQTYWEVASFRKLGSVRDVAAHGFAAFLFANPGARKAWESTRDGGRNIREQLDLPFLNTEGGIGIVSTVRADLEKLDGMNE